MHEYRPRLLRSPWLRGVYALSAMFAVFAVSTGSWRAAIGPILGPSAAVAMVHWRRLRLRLGPEGVAVNQVSVPWSALASIERHGVGPAAQDVFVLREPLEYPKWLTFGKTKSLPLGLYDPNWRTGPIGEDVERWAPHLVRDR